MYAQVCRSEAIYSAFESCGGLARRGQSKRKVFNHVAVDSDLAVDLGFASMIFGAEVGLAAAAVIGGTLLETLALNKGCLLPMHGALLRAEPVLAWVDEVGRGEDGALLCSNLGCVCLCCARGGGSFQKAEGSFVTSDALQSAERAGDLSLKGWL